MHCIAYNVLRTVSSFEYQRCEFLQKVLYVDRIQACCGILDSSLELVSAVADSRPIRFPSKMVTCGSGCLPPLAIYKHLAHMQLVRLQRRTCQISMTRVLHSRFIFTSYINKCCLSVHFEHSPPVESNGVVVQDQVPRIFKSEPSNAATRVI